MMDQWNKDMDRLNFHLMPPNGWLNDPNGLGRYQGFYHVFFQYSPNQPEGGLKSWGHYRSKDWIDWEYLGEAIRPDTAFDRDGAYSGCAFTEDGSLELFYTGNVKHKGEFDYIHSGREAHVLYRRSEDGIHFSEKELLLSNRDYPEDYTCHVRDPKVWKEGDRYYMILGGRKKDDQGAALIYTSEDKKNWRLDREVRSEGRFGYMWECPELFAVEGRKVLSFCPQGLPAEEGRFENAYQSGYVFWDGKTVSEPFETFTEWDRGFDFYAPQTFQDQDGRRILIGWAGMIDTYYGNERTVRAGWQHALTVPREVTLESAGGRLLQNPIRELLALRKEPEVFSGPQNSGLWESELSPETASSMEILIDFADGDEPKEILINGELSFSFQDQTAALTFLNESGLGRDQRKAKISQLKQVRILADASLVEVYLNQGEMVFTTRYYPLGKERFLRIRGRLQSAVIYPLSPMRWERADASDAQGKENV